jgi:hypothetical protein
VSLLENLTLLGATAVVTGLGVAFVKDRMDGRRLAHQRVAEEQLARDTKFIDSQAQLLDELSTTLWDFAGLALAVSYYRAFGTPDQGEQAWTTYDERSFEMLTRFRAIVSRSQRLVSPATHARLTELFDWWFRELDPRLSTLARGGAKAGEWADHHRATMDELFPRTDAALEAVADDIGATRPQRSGE